MELARQTGINDQTIDSQECAAKNTPVDFIFENDLLFLRQFGQQ